MIPVEELMSNRYSILIASKTYPNAIDIKKISQFRSNCFNIKSACFQVTCAKPKIKKN